MTMIAQGERLGNVKGLSERGASGLATAMQPHADSRQRALPNYAPPKGGKEAGKSSDKAGRALNGTLHFLSHGSGRSDIVVAPRASGRP